MRLTDVSAVHVSAHRPAWEAGAASETVTVEREHDPANDAHDDLEVDPDDDDLSHPEGGSSPLAVLVR